MNITNIRQDSVNSMMLEIDGQKFRIHGEAEIGLREAKKSIPGCFGGAENLEEAREKLHNYGRELVAAK